MPRQRLRQRTPPLAFVGRALTFALALALVWYGLMTVLLAIKVSATTVDSLSGYRAIYEWASGLTPDDVDADTTRAVMAGAGIAAFFIFGYLAYKQLPRPYLARRDLELAADDHGEVTVEPRAIERLAEVAAASHPAVTEARGRYGRDDLSVDITVRRARDLATTLQDAQQRVVDALGRHDLPAMPVNVTLTGYDRRHRRDLQ
jgi:hypothetical protein